MKILVSVGTQYWSVPLLLFFIVFLFYSILEGKTTFEFL